MRRKAVITAVRCDTQRSRARCIGWIAAVSVFAAGLGIAQDPATQDKALQTRRPRRIHPRSEDQIRNTWQSQLKLHVGEVVRPLVTR
jgi:hypothetical protein